MTGIVSKFKAIFKARAYDAAARLEDPHSSLDYSLARLEENRRELNRSLVVVIAARHRLQSQRNRLLESIEKYNQQAGASLNAGRDDLAVRVLAQQQEAASQLAGLETNIASIEDQVESLKQSHAALDRRIALFQSKKEELKALFDSSQAQLRVRESLTGISMDLADVGDTIRRIEERIQMMRSRADAINYLVVEGLLPDALGPGNEDIDRQLRQIDMNNAVEEELARLKSEASS